MKQNQDELYGKLVKNIDYDGPTVSPEDLSRHMYIIGGSGSGKTTLIRNQAKHLELANIKNTLHSAFIYIDVKDEDAKLFLRQSEKENLENGNTIFLDINHTDFAINLLELPGYTKENRDNIISRKIGNVMDLFKEFYDQQQTFVRMERIIKLLLNFLYQNIDNPSMLDLYQIIVRLQDDGKTELLRIKQHLKNVSSYEMESALNSVAGLKSDVWDPLLSRIEPFATDLYLRKIFGVEKSTINFSEMLKAGRQTFIRISDTETPHYATGLAIMGIVIAIWFAIQERASKTNQDSDERNLVVLCLDEFQRVQSLTILKTMLEQARSYNLGLILSHQNLQQIDEKLLGSTAGNTATQIYGRVFGLDSSKIARIIDPQFSNELTWQISSQPDFVFTVKTRAPIGEEQGTPQRFRSFSPPELKISEDEAKEFFILMKERYGRKSDEVKSVFQQRADESSKWMLQLADSSTFLEDEHQWKILLALRNNGTLNIKRITEEIQHNDRSQVSDILEKMKEFDLIKLLRTKTDGSGAGPSKYFGLTNSAMTGYFPDSFEAIGEAADINEVAQQAFDFHIQNGNYITIANQDLREGKDRSDMISYDYTSQKAVSIEIESLSEVESHPEQVRYNMIKWKSLGFSKCEVWSKSKKVEEIYDKLDSELKQDIEIHLVE